MVALVFWDLIRVTMGEGGGILTRRIASWPWRMFLRLQRRESRLRPLAVAGPFIILLSVGTWIVLLWTGWTLIFHGTERAVVHGQTQYPAAFWERVYFTGFTIFTLGIGDFVPNGRIWQVLTAVASANGLFLATLSISYLIPVIQAATHKRQLAVQIASLGQTPSEILLKTYDGSGYGPLGEHLMRLTSDLSKLEQRHLSYPLLHYFHSRTHTESIALSVAALDEALTIIEHGLKKQAPGVDPGFFNPARRMITNYLKTMERAFVEAAGEVPPPPRLDVLRRHGLPVVEDATFRTRLEELSDRRRLLLALVENNGWSWQKIDSEAPS